MKNNNSFSKILFIAAIGFVLLLVITIGGIFYLKNSINSQLNPPKAELMQRAEKIGDFSKLPKGYSVAKAMNIFGISAVIGEYSKTGQYMAIIDTKWSIKLAKDDINNGNLRQKLMDFAQKVNTPHLSLSNMEIQPKGTFTAFNQAIPYAYTKISFSQLNSHTSPSKKLYEGIIGIVESPKTSKLKLIVSVNTKGNFNQKVAEKFFKNVSVQ